MNQAWWFIEYYCIWGSATVSGLFHDYKIAATPCFGGSYGETSDVFPRWGFLEIWELAMIKSGEEMALFGLIVGINEDIF